MPNRLTLSFYFFIFFNDTATTEIYTLSLHDALPISPQRHGRGTGGSESDSEPPGRDAQARRGGGDQPEDREDRLRSEEHTSELQSRQYFVCRLLLEKKKNIMNMKLQFQYYTTIR